MVEIDVEFFKSLGPVWTPVLQPPELGSVPLDVGRMSESELVDWWGKCTAWLSYAHSQLGLVEAQKSLLQRRFARIANELIVSKQVKQRTYELQVAEVAKESKDLPNLQEGLAQLEAKVALWSRMARAYDAYCVLFQKEIERRRWERK